MRHADVLRIFVVAAIALSSRSQELPPAPGLTIQLLTDCGTPRVAARTRVAIAHGASEHMGYRAVESPWVADSPAWATLNARACVKREKWMAPTIVAGGVVAWALRLPGRLPPLDAAQSLILSLKTNATLRYRLEVGAAPARAAFAPCGRGRSALAPPCRSHPALASHCRAHPALAPCWLQVGAAPAAPPLGDADSLFDAVTVSQARPLRGCPIMLW
jgi:hypothetical protein